MREDPQLFILYGLFVFWFLSFSFLNRRIHPSGQMRPRDVENSGVFYLRPTYLFSHSDVNVMNVKLCKLNELR